MAPERKKRENFCLPAVTLDRTSPVALHRQLQRQVTAAIRSGLLPAGARVPSTRLLAKLLAISRNTVTTAYEELAADGLLELQERRRVRVRSSGFETRVELPAVRSILRAAQFPARTQAFADPDGNALYLNIS